MSVPAISSGCHSLQLPPVEKDDRLNLNVRTGSSSTLYNSFVFTFGGLTLGLDLPKLTIEEILGLFTTKLSNSPNSKNFLKYLSSELFYLNLLEKAWYRVVVGPKDPKPEPRLLHEIVATNNCLYLYGGLIINPIHNLSDKSTPATIPTDLLIPTNDLWEFNLETNKWSQLYIPESTPSSSAPRPSFCHKLTVVDSLSFAGKPDHHGILIAGGKDHKSNLLYDNLVFDLVDNRFIDGPHYLNVNMSNDSKDGDNFMNTDDHYNLNVDYYNSSILSFNNQFNHYHQSSKSTETKTDDKTKIETKISEHIGSKTSEAILIYSPVKDPAKISNPLLSFRLSKTIKTGKMLPVHRKLNEVNSSSNQVIPYNLRYPVAGLFGQNLILTGFLPNDYDISIFVFNRPTGKWSRLNIFCNHDYGSHRFWGGFAWHSHHKVVLLGNYVTSRTTSSIRYFTCLITVNLPVTNILASSELAGGGHYHDEKGNRVYFDEYDNSGTASGGDSYETSSDKEIKPLDAPLTPPNDSRRPSYASKGSRGSVSTSKSPRAISFSEYVHYAAPTTNFTTISSIFPPAAITLGRNFFDRFGDLTADFEVISVNGDRIPVSLMVLIERWGTYFIELLARGYVTAVEKFDQNQHNLTDQSVFSRSRDRSWNSNLKTSIGSSISSSNSTDRKSTPKQSPLSSQLSSQNPSGATSQVQSPRVNSEEKFDKTYHLSIPLGQKRNQKDAPQFRLPFQDNLSVTSSEKSDKESSAIPYPDKESTPIENPRKDSSSSFSSNSSLLNSHLSDIPAQLPLPTEPIPPVPTNPPTFRSSSRRNSNDLSSPRGSLIHTLTALRNIPLTKSPRGSPFTSPRPSISQQGGIASLSSELSSSSTPSLKPLTSIDAKSRKYESPEPRLKKSDSANDSDNSLEDDKLPSTGDSSKENISDPLNSNKDPSKEQQENIFNPFNNILLNFEDLENGSFQMESSLIPRKLYVPFTTTSIKAFCEYLYTGQIGNKWLLAPTTLDNLALSKHYKVPLLYDLISEVLYGIIGRREAWVINRSNELKAKYFKLLRETGSSHDTDFVFPLDEYQGFIDTVDDGYLDIQLLKKSLRFSQSGTDQPKPQKKRDSKSSRRSSRRSSVFDTTVQEQEDEANQAESELDPNEIEDGDPLKDDKSYTDSSVDKETSASEEDDQDGYGIGYLNTNPESVNMGPRSKSIFDRSDPEKKRSSMDGNSTDENHIYNEFDKDKGSELTLEQLVSPSSPIPNVETIDLIYEAVSLVSDLKLLLRANNVRQMSRLLVQFEEDIEERMESIKSRHDHTQQLIESRERSASSLTLDTDSILNHDIPPPSVLKRTDSNTSVNTLSSHKSLATTPSLPFQETFGHHGSADAIAATKLERSRTNSSLRTGISGLTPFKPVVRAETNKETDKRITKLIKREEKLKINQMKLDKKKAKEGAKELKRAQTDLSRSSSRFFDDQATIHSVDDKEKRSRHLFSFGGQSKAKEHEEKPKLTRNNSSTSSVVSASSKTSENTSSSKKKHSLFGLKK